MFDYVLGAVFMSLAWSLRGQFGHLKGALIPGAAAAAIVVLLHREELWRKAFGWAVLFSALGFSLGGDLSYGALINRLLETNDFSLLLTYFSELFLKGALWGGLGMTFLGFSLQETPFRRSDLILVAFLGLLWFIPLGVLEHESFDLLFYGTGLLIMHLYNFFFKKSRMISLFGARGIVGIGLGFVLSVLILYLGKRGFLGNGWPWWHLRDQIIGILAGCALVSAFHRSVRLELFPSPDMITPGTQKCGLLFFAVMIPVIQIVTVFEYWLFELSLPFNRAMALSLFSFSLFFPGLILFLMKGDESYLSEKRLEHVLFILIMIFCWLLSAVAILKELLPFGPARWEPAHTFFIVYSGLLTLLLPIKIYRKD